MDEDEKPDSKWVSALRQRGHLISAAFLKKWVYWLPVAGAVATVVWGKQETEFEFWVRVAAIPATALLAVLHTAYSYWRFRRKMDR